MYLLDALAGVDEVDAVVVVLLEPRGDGEDVGVEDDVLGREAHLVHQDVVRALADLDLLREEGGRGRGEEEGRERWSHTDASANVYPYLHLSIDL